MHFPPKFLQKPPPTFSVVHLLHRVHLLLQYAPLSVVSRFLIGRNWSHSSGAAK